MIARTVSTATKPVAVLIVVLMLTFLLVPLVALITYQPLHLLIHGFGTRVATDAIVVSLKTSAAALAITLVIGTPAAFLLARTRFPGRTLILTLTELPLVLPPAVAGVALLVAFGRFGLLGSDLKSLGINLVFTQAAVIVSLVFVAGPFYLRGAIAAFEAVDQTLLDAAATLGAGPLQRLLRIAVPVASGGLGAAAAVSFARGIGEFGATILFAGSFQGTTQTLSLAVYSLFDADNVDEAVAVGVLLVIVSFLVLLLAKFLSHQIGRGVTTPARRLWQDVRTWRSGSSGSPPHFAA